MYRSTLKYGVLAGLTGDPAADGQAWNEAARLGIDQIAKALERLNLTGIKVELADSQDSQGSPQPGVEGAQKLVNVDHVQVIIGDFYSSVTSAVATAVTIPNNVADLHRRHQPGAEQAQRRPAGRAGLGAGRRGRHSGQGPCPPAGRGVRQDGEDQRRGPQRRLRRGAFRHLQGGVGGRRRHASRNSSSTITSSRRSTPKRSRSSTAIRTAGSSSTSARPSRSSHSR